MNASRHITFSSAVVALCSGQAIALSPLPPPCSYSGDNVEGREIVHTEQQANGFVTYASTDDAERSYLYLEHCQSGKTLRAKSQPYKAGLSGPRSADEIAHTVYRALGSEKSYTLGAIQALLRDQGVQTKRYTTKRESCACQTYYPANRGSKTPYKKDAK